MGGQYNVITFSRTLSDRPTLVQARVNENRTGRLAPSHGALPLEDRMAELPADIAISLAVPENGTATPEQHARSLFQSAQRLLASTLETVRE